MGNNTIFPVCFTTIAHVWHYLFILYVPGMTIMKKNIYILDSHYLLKSSWHDVSSLGFTDFLFPSISVRYLFSSALTDATVLGTQAQRVHFNHMDQYLKKQNNVFLLNSMKIYVQNWTAHVRQIKNWWIHKDILYKQLDIAKEQMNIQKIV